MNEKNGIMEIDIKKLLLYYLRRLWLIVLAALVLGGGAYVYARFHVPVTYRTRTTIFVNNFDGDTQYTTVSGVSNNGRLVSTYITILTSDRVLDRAVILLNGDYTAAQIKSMVSAARMGDTEILAIYVTGAVPEETARIANVMGVVVMEELSKIIEGSSARILDTAVVPQTRYAPNYQNYILKGAVAGAAAVVLILTVLFLLDVRIKDADDLTALFDIPVLGQIPDFHMTGKETKRGYGGTGKTNDYDTSTKRSRKE